MIKIETYWNVNTSAQMTETPSTYIKIETYWNVNVTLAVAGVTALTALK